MATLSPECQQAFKCPACTRDGYDEATDEVGPCQHHCHEQPEPEDFAEVFDEDGMPDL